MASPVLNGGQFTVGPNNSIAILQGGSEIDIGIITTVSWRSNQEVEKKKVNLMSGFTFIVPFVQNWAGEFTIQRTDNKLDSVWYNLFEVPYRAGLGYPSFTIIQTIKETDNTTTRYTFQGAAIFYDDAGTFENEEVVTQKLSFSSPLRIVKNA